MYMLLFTQHVGHGAEHRRHVYVYAGSHRFTTASLDDGAISQQLHL